MLQFISRNTATHIGHERKIYNQVKLEKKFLRTSSYSYYFDGIASSEKHWVLVKRFDIKSMEFRLSIL